PTCVARPRVHNVRGMLERLARFTIHHRKLVVLAWVVLTVVGAFSANAINKRWLDQFSIPGYSAYEANQRTLKLFGTGAQPPHVALFTVKGDATKDRAITAALAKFHRQFPKFRIGSYYSTQSRAYVSRTGTARSRRSIRPASRASAPSRT